MTAVLRARYRIRIPFPTVKLKGRNRPRRQRNDAIHHSSIEGAKGFLGRRWGCCRLVWRLDRWKIGSAGARAFAQETNPSERNRRVSREFLKIPVSRLAEGGRAIELRWRIARIRFTLASWRKCSNPLLRGFAQLALIVRSFAARIPCGCRRGWKPGRQSRTIGCVRRGFGADRKISVAYGAAGNAVFVFCYLRWRGRARRSSRKRKERILERILASGVSVREIGCCTSGSFCFDRNRTGDSHVCLGLARLPPRAIPRARTCRAFLS